MNKEAQSIIKNLENTLSGEPWFGRAVFPILKETDESKVYTKPNGTEHSLIELLYHMITWAEFTLSRIDKSHPLNLAKSGDMDWREIDPTIHTWKDGLNQFKKTHDQLIKILETKEDAFLSGMVEERKYNFRFLLNGLIQHNIYHLGQVAYVKKLLG